MLQQNEKKKKRNQEKNEEQEFPLENISGIDGKALYKAVNVI